jgi:hypothetical protein
MSDNGTFLPMVERLLRLVDPENPRPIYLVDVATVEDKRLDAGIDWTAWTGLLIDLQLQDELERQGRWSGRGFATLLRLDRLELGFRFVAGCVLHEYAHHLECLVDHEREFDQQVDPQVAAARKRVGLMTTEITARWMTKIPTQGNQDAPRWAGHELPFVRACCHLAYRANNVFESIRPGHLRFIKPYHGHLVSERPFIEACGSEIQSGDPLVEILRTPPPRGLVDLWELITATG